MKAPITTLGSLVNNGENLIVCCENNEPIGYLKYSTRHLYFYTKKGKVYECDPICILDFYVLQSKQRNGIGKMLLDSVNTYVCANFHNILLNSCRYQSLIILIIQLYVRMHMTVHQLS